MHIFLSLNFSVVARCSLHFVLLSLIFACCLLLVIFSSKLPWNKITVNRKKKVWLQRNSATDIFLFWDFGNIFGMVVFKVFSTCKTTFKVDIKSQIFPELISIWCLYYNIWTRFIYFYVLEFYKNGVLKYSTKSGKGNICAGVSFVLKLQAGGLEFH